MHPTIARWAFTPDARRDPILTDTPRRSRRIQLDDALVALGHRTVQFGANLTTTGVRRGGQPHTSGAPPGHPRPA